MVGRGTCHKVRVLPVYSKHRAGERWRGEVTRARRAGVISNGTLIWGITVYIDLYILIGL